MYDYMLQSFKGHTDQILHRSSGIFPSNDFYDFIRRRFPEPEHDQRRKRLLVIPAGDRGCNSIPRQSQAGHLAAQLDDDLLRRFQPQSLDIFEKDGVFGSDDPLQLPRRIGRESSGRYCRLRRRHLSGGGTVPVRPSTRSRKATGRLPEPRNERTVSLGRSARFRNMSATISEESTPLRRHPTRHGWERVRKWYRRDIRT